MVGRARRADGRAHRPRERGGGRPPAAQARRRRRRRGARRRRVPRGRHGAHRRGRIQRTATTGCPRDLRARLRGQLRPGAQRPPRRSPHRRATRPAPTRSGSFPLRSRRCAIHLAAPPEERLALLEAAGRSRVSPRCACSTSRSAAAASRTPRTPWTRCAPSIPDADLAVLRRRRRRPDDSRVASRRRSARAASGSWSSTAPARRRSTLDELRALGYAAAAHHAAHRRLAEHQRVRGPERVRRGRIARRAWSPTRSPSLIAAKGDVPSKSGRCIMRIG